jgi:flavodoxin
MMMRSFKLAFSLICLSHVKAFSPLKINERHFVKNASSCSEKRNINGRADILLLAAKVGIFFGSSTGNTEGVAEMICSEFGDDAEGPFEIDEFQGKVGEKFAAYDALIVGTPTWNTGADSERSGTGWDEIYYGEMQDLKIVEKNVAVFGLGDQISYGENYADASGEVCV